MRWIRDRGQIIRDESGEPITFTGAVVDITEQHQLQEERERFAILIENSPDLVGMCDLNFVPYYANPACLNFIGLDSLDNLHGITILDLFYPEDHAFLTQEFFPKVLREGHGETEIRLRNLKTGEHIWLLYSVVPLRNNDGEAVGLATISRNIDERKHSESLIRESERQFHQLADSMPQIVWMSNPDGGCFYFNERWYDFTGHDPSLTVGNRDWPRIVHDDDLEKVAADWAEAVKQRIPYESECRFKDEPNGGYYWYLVRAIPAIDSEGKIVRWYGTCTDIDTRKRSDEANRFVADASVALSEVGDRVSTLDRIANVAVPRFADWCMIDLLDDEGTLQRVAVTHSDLTIINKVQEMSDRYPARLDNAFGTPQLLKTGESQLVPHIDDSILQAVAHNDEHLNLLRSIGYRSYVCVPLRLNGKVAGALTFVTAESGRRYDEISLQAAADIAYRASIAIDNASLYDQLREADRRKDEFLATLAHELRNPLAPIRTGLEVMKMAKDKPDTVERIRGTMERQVQQLVTLIDDLMDVSRITRGKLELRLTQVSLEEVVRSAVEATQPFIDEQRHTLSVQLPETPTQLHGDPNRLAQVVSNLLNNAAKYTREPGQITLNAQVESNGDVVIAIRDTGAGIPLEKQESIFEMFTQLDGQGERVHAGLGIGLTLVKSLVQMHGGSIHVQSEGDGKGSEFTVRLPSYQSPRKLPEPLSALHTHEPRRSHRVMVVDDNRAAAESLRTMLTLWGHEVETAHDGLAGFEAARELRPDLMLLDLGMPKLNGYETAGRIRSQEWGRSITLVAVTGWGQKRDRDRTTAAGFDYHLVKPVEPDAIRTILANLKKRPAEL